MTFTKRDAGYSNTKKPTLKKKISGSKMIPLGHYFVVNNRVPFEHHFDAISQKCPFVKKALEQSAMRWSKEIIHLVNLRMAGTFRQKLPMILFTN